MNGHWARLLVLLFAVALAACEPIHGQASAEGGSSSGRSAGFLLGSGIRF